MKKEETDRDSSLERLMRDTLRAQVSDVSDTSDTSRCLDTDTLAAWAEQTLSARKRSSVETHAATCARCQAMLAAMARTTPAPVEAPWWRVHMMAWMLPMSAATAALIVWAALPARTALESRQAATQIAAPAPSTPSAVATPAKEREVAGQETPKPQANDESRPTTVDKDLKLDQGRQQRMSFRRADAQESPTSSLAKAEAPPAQAKVQAQAAAEETRTNAAADTRAKAVADAAAAPPPVPAPAPAPAAAPPVPALPARASAPPATPPAFAAPERAALGAARAEGVVAPRAERDLLAARVAVAPSGPIVSPNPSNRWRLMPGGTVQHSTDGGSTWQTQQTGVDVMLTTGASPAALVCWLVGPGGRVLLSTDGATWKLVSIAQPIDLIAVRATDAKSATVTASDGHTFATTDGGVTWTPR